MGTKEISSFPTKRSSFPTKRLSFPTKLKETSMISYSEAPRIGTATYQTWRLGLRPILHDFGMRTKQLTKVN